jgi:hypothetical protein
VLNNFLSFAVVVSLSPCVFAQCSTDAFITKRTRRLNGNQVEGRVIGWTKNGDWWNWYIKAYGEVYFTPSGGATTKIAEGMREGWSWGPSSNPNEPHPSNPTWTHLAELEPRGNGSYFARGWGTFTQPWCGIVGTVSAENSPAQGVLRPTISGPGGSASAAFWYLQGAPSIDGYYVQSSLSGNVNWFPEPGQPTPAKSWSTDSPNKLSINVTGSTVSTSTAALTSTGHSGFGSYTFDIFVTFSADGFKSQPFPIFINVPYTMTTSYASTTCTSIGRSEPGYVTTVRHSITDLAGGFLAPITTTESLENIKYVGGYSSSNSNWLAVPPTPATWTAANWFFGNYFIDDLWACGTLTPSPGSTTNAVIDETQKFWVGSAQGFNGRCVQRGVVTLYGDRGVVSPFFTPVTSQSDCAVGAFLN